MRSWAQDIYNSRNYRKPFSDPAEDYNCRCVLLQRARWALCNDYTKWSADAPLIIDDNSATQLIKISANDYGEFKGFYKDITGQMTMNLQFFAKKHVSKNVPRDNPLWDSLVKGDIEQQKIDGIFEWEHGGYDYLIEYNDDYAYNVLSKKKKPNIHEK